MKKRIIAGLTIKDNLVVQSISYEKYLPLGKLEYFVKNFISKEDNLKILDIGSLQLPRSSNKDELQPSLKQTFDGDKWKYIGCDMVEGTTQNSGLHSTKWRDF